MKIVCDACQAKYSISDDKVQGKVFKIRCKKCSNIIVVRGGAGAAEPAPAPQQEKDTRVYDYGYEGGDHAPAGDESVWHVVINQDQVGPMTAVEVQQRFGSGDIDSETYIWREGFTDWLPLSQVDTFASLIASGRAPARGGGGGSEAIASMFGGGEDAAAGRSDPGDLFAAASASAGHHDDDAADLFGGKPAAAPVNQAANSKMRGERNENSVLFSLNNLAQLASDKPVAAAAHAAPSASSGGSSSGGSGGEGSGLIDIRSMASAYLGGPGGGSSKPVSAGIGSIDDLPVFGGGGFSEPQVIVPIASRSNSNKLMYALIGSVGLLAVAAVVVVVVLLKGAADRPAQVAGTRPELATPEAKTSDSAQAAPDPTPAKPTATKPDSTAPAANAEPKPAAAANPTNPQVAANDPPAEPKHTAPPTPPPPVHRPTPSTAPAATPPAQPAQPRQPKPVAEKPASPPKADPPAAKGDCDEISCVLNNNEGPCCAKFAKKGNKAAPSGALLGAGKSDLPESLDRAMISDGISKVRARVMSCGDKSQAKGQVKVSVKVGPDGHVANVTVKNTPDDALGNCVAGMVQKATFAKTQTGGLFAYPYTF